MRKDFNTPNPGDNADLTARKENSLFIRQYSSPIPPASEFKELQAVNSNFPERLMSIVEAHAHADVKGKLRSSFTLVFSPILTTVIALAGFGLSAFFAVKGTQAGTITAIIGGIAPIIIAALANLGKR
jgi:uncharacterized membrane protein